MSDPSFCHWTDEEAVSSFIPWKERRMSEPTLAVGCCGREVIRLYAVISADRVRVAPSPDVSLSLNLMIPTPGASHQVVRRVTVASGSIGPEKLVVDSSRTA